MKLLKIIILTIIFYSLFLTTAIAADDYLPPPAKWEPQYNFSGYMRGIIKDSFPGVEEMANLNYNGTVSIVAIPTMKSPVKYLEELSEGKTIGGLFLSTGSVRLNLPPGAYQVVVLQKEGKWKVQFLDGGGNPKGEITAHVQRAPIVKIPFAYVDRSVCHRFDETLVCY